MYDLVKLKQEIEQNKFNKELLICVCKDESSRFVAKQYLHFYAKANNYDIIEREDVISSKATLDWLAEPTEVYLHEVEELSYEPLKSAGIWIICSKVRTKIAKDYDEYIVEIPKLEDWQIVDYLTSVSPITEEQAKRIIAEYKDITKIDIEIKKLSLFRENKFNDIVDQLLFNLEPSVFDLINGLVKRDKNAVATFVSTGVDVEPFGFLTLLKKNIKQVIDIQLAQNPTAESTGLSGKQFWAVSQYSCGHYTREELLYIYDVLTQIDLQIKSGTLDTSNVVNYILSKFLVLIG